MIYKALRETGIIYSHIQDTPHLKTMYFNSYEDALTILKWLWHNARKTYYNLDAYYNYDRKRYYGAFKYKIFAEYEKYSNGDSTGRINEYYISWRKQYDSNSIIL